MPALLAAAMALALWLAPVQAQTPTVPVVVRMVPSPVQVQAGGTADVAVEVVDVEALYGFDVTVSFDPQVVEVVDSDPNLPGVQVTQGLFLDPGFAVINQADNAVGTVHFVMTQLNPSEAKNGTGTLIVIKLLGKQAGSGGTLGLPRVQLARRDGFMIPAEGVAGQVEVIAAGGPTTTPMPTQGAGTPMATTTPEPTLPPATATAHSATATSVMATVTSLAATASALPAATSTLPAPATPSATAVAGDSTAAVVPTVSPSPTVTGETPAVPGTEPPATIVAIAPGGSTPAPGSTLHVPAGTAGARKPAGRPDAARAMLWIAVASGALAVAAGAALLAIRLRSRRRGQQ
jgi:hypothetical protein